MSDAKLTFRRVLLSTGELVFEAVIRDGDIEVYEASPRGLTRGASELALYHTSNSPSYVLEGPLPSFQSQADFDAYVETEFPRELWSAISFAGLKYYSRQHAQNSDHLYQYVQSIVREDSTNQPKPIFNVLNGGPHGGNGLTFCEFMIIPDGVDTADRIRLGSEIYLALGRIIAKRFGTAGALVGREGGYSPPINETIEALDLIEEAIGTDPAFSAHLAIDVAATTFSLKIKESFCYKIRDLKLSSQQIVEHYSLLARQYPNLVYLEDPLHEHDEEGYHLLRAGLNDSVQIVADDLIVSQADQISRYRGVIDLCILKMDQAGTFSKLLEANRKCQSLGIGTVMSHRSGETDSCLLPHLAVGLNAAFIKAGAPARERILKYNELARILDRQRQ